MATIVPKDIQLNATNITGSKSQEYLVDGFRDRYKIDKVTKTRTEELEGYSVDIRALKGAVQTVKLPLNVDATVIEQIREAVKADKDVTISFGKPSTLRGKFYALLNNGALVQGVSCTASKIEIISIKDSADEFEEEFIE